MTLPSGKIININKLSGFDDRERMDESSRDKWVAALESGDYKQGRATLFDGDKHCCLGVKAEIDGCKFIKERNSFAIEGGYYSQQLPQLYERGLGELGHFRSFELYCDNRSYCSLAELNDSIFDFKDIAHIIKHLF